MTTVLNLWLTDNGLADSASYTGVTIPVSSKLYLLVFVARIGTAAPTVTINGTSMSQIASVSNMLWSFGMANPPSGSQTVVVSAGTPYIYLLSNCVEVQTAATYPFSAMTASQISVSVAPLSGSDLFLDLVMVRRMKVTPPVNIFGVGDGQVMSAVVSNHASNNKVCSSYKASEVTTQMTWSVGTISLDNLFAGLYLRAIGGTIKMRNSAYFIS